MNIEIKRIIKALGAGSLLSVFMLTGRITLTGEITFVFLLWNLFLAWLPLCFSILLLNKTNAYNIGVKGFVLCIMWLAFFPNAPYLITDLIHLKPRPGAPYWFDILLITTFVWNGILLCFVSLHLVQTVISKIRGIKTGWVVVIFSLFLSGYGIYLGRFLRWNTWDILLNPFSLMYDMANGFLFPHDHFRMWGVTLFFSLFLIIGYITFWSFFNRSNNKIISETL